MEQSVSEIERKAIQELYSRIKDDLMITKVVLFGSKARGEAEEYSDVDLLVLTEKVKTKEDREKLSEITADINIDYGVALSCIYFSASEWNSSDEINPLLKENIEKEGVSIVV